MLALLLGYDMNTAGDRELGAIVDRFRSLRPFLRGFSSDDYNNLLSGDAWMHQMWSGDIAALLSQAEDPSIYGFEAPSQGTPINSDTYAIPINARHPGTALLFIDYMLRPENVEKNINYIGYPMPVHGTEATYQEIVADYPECTVTVGDLGRNLYFTNDSVAKTQGRRGVHGDEGRTMTSATTTYAETHPPRQARKERLWTWMLLPGTAWMSVFFVSALLLLIALSFGTTDALGNPRFGSTLDNIVGIFNPTYLRVIVRSLVYAVAASAICLVIAYPVAYAIARHGGRYKNALVALLVVPFFANYLVRMYGWQTLLSDESMLMTWLRRLGVSANFHILDTAPAVIGGLVYGYVVFMILPLYASLERMDGALIEAGRDLYGSSLRTFFTVTVPASRSGAYAGVALVFLPAMGDFISAQLLGGPDNLMVGNLIQEKFFAGQNWPLGAALTMALMVLLLICMFAYLRQTARDAKEARR